MSLKRPCCDGARRTLLLGAAVGFVARPVLAAALAQDPRSQRPQAGDRLVYVEGERKGASVAPEDLPAGGPQVLAWPMAPDTNSGNGVVRDGSRGNQILLLRLDPSTLDADTRPRSADGVIAYAALCSHAGCIVKIWDERDALLQCPCHNSHYDPRKAAAVVSGPAPRRLAALPLAVRDGVLTVAAPFIGAVGPTTGQ